MGLRVLLCVTEGEATEPDQGSEVNRIRAKVRAKRRKIQPKEYRDFDNLSSYFLFGTHSNGMYPRCKLMRGMWMRENLGRENGVSTRGRRGSVGSERREVRTRTLKTAGCSTRLGLFFRPLLKSPPAHIISSPERRGYRTSEIGPEPLLR
jgi:hypothetical protein